MSQHPQPGHVPYAGMYTPRPPGKWRGLFGWFIFIALCIVLFVILQKDKQSYLLVNLSDITEQLELGNVNRVVVEGDAIKAELRNPVAFAGLQQPMKLVKAELPAGAGANWAFTEWLLRNRKGATVSAENSQNVLMSIIVPLIPWLLIFGFIWFFVFRQLRSQAQLRQAPPVYMTPPVDRPGEPPPSA
jgi:cell division protease FtsH